MEFDRSKVFTSVNADELKAGDKVLTSNNIASLKEAVRLDVKPSVIVTIWEEKYDKRFKCKSKDAIYDAELAYLVERKENCTNCVNCENCVPPVVNLEAVKRYNCKFYERAEPKTEKKHYRPFRDVNELIKVWEEKTGATPYWGKGADLVMPHIWVKYKYDEKSKESLITDFSDDQVALGDKEEDYMTMKDLFDNFTFLDGSPCGVEE